MSLLLAQQTPFPEGWELAGRIIVVIGIAGLVGLIARRIGLWLQNRYRRKSK